MNNEFNLNTRTLIVSFVLALAVMVPLRFVEVGNLSSYSSVLGDSIESPTPRIEAPYDVMEQGGDCLQNQYVDQVIANLTKASDIESFNLRRCK